MASPLNILPQMVSQGQAKLIYAQVTTPIPTAFTQSLNVVMPDWSTNLPFAFPHWPALYGSALPALNDDVLLVQDSRGNLRVVWWGHSSTVWNVLNGITVPLTGSAWIAPSLINSWANFGSGFETAGYLKDPLGFVHLRGFITGTSATVAFVLPAGYRPAALTDHPGGWGNGSSRCVVQVSSAGNVTPSMDVNGGAGLSGITFLAEN